MERVARIELASSAWKAEVLPLNYTRQLLLPNHCPNRRSLLSQPNSRPTKLVEGGGFEPPKLARQIYSLIPLATQEPLRNEALNFAHESIRCQLNFGEKVPAPVLFAQVRRFTLLFLPFFWCRHQESNSGPTEYKSVALPTEL